MLGHLPYRVMFAAFQIVAAFGAVLIASQYLPAEQVGALRLLTTFLLMGYSLSPVNPKMLYIISRTVEGPADLLRVMRPFSPVFAALLLGWLVAVIAIGWTRMSDGRLYLYALSVYPVVLFSAVLERLLLNRRGIRTVGLVVGTFAALTAVALLMRHDLEYYAVVLILCVAAYPLVLTIFLSPRFLPIALLAVLLAGIGALSIGGFIIAAAAVAALTTGVAVLSPRLLS